MLLELSEYQIMLDLIISGFFEVSLQIVSMMFRFAKLSSYQIDIKIEFI